MKMVKKIGLFFGAMFLVAGASICQADTATTSNAATSGMRVAIVNVQQVLQQSPRVAALSKKLEGQFETRKAKITDQQKSLQNELEKYKKEAPTMSQKDRDGMQKKVANDRADLVKQVVAYQQDLQKEQGKIMQNILTDLTGVVSSIAKTNSYSLVLDSQAVIFSSTGNDITKDVAKDFNAKG